MFFAYAKIGNNKYREIFGLDFENFEKGQVFKHRPGITLSQQDNTDEALDTINSAQLHYDSHYASQTEWKECLGVSTLTIQKVLGSSWKTFAKKDRIIRFHSIAMTAPVFGGNTLYAESKILETADFLDNRDVGKVTVETVGINQEGVIVTKINYDLLIYRSGCHPSIKNDTSRIESIAEERFLSHHQLADKSYVEQVGLFYEDLIPDEIFEHQPGKTISCEENLQHSLRSLDWNPKYVDFEYIRKFYRGKHCINESYILGAGSASSTRTFGRVVANLEWKNLEMHKPAYVEDTLYSESKILSKRESKSRPTQGIVVEATQVFNQAHELILSYERTLLVYKKGFGPYEKAGY